MRKGSRNLTGPDRCPRANHVGYHLLPQTPGDIWLDVPRRVDFETLQLYSAP